MKGNYRIYPSLEVLHGICLALSPVEVQELKLAAKSSQGNPDDLAYINFFNVLRKFPVFDKKEIVNALQGTSTLKRFTDSKNYLYHKVLLALKKANHDLSFDVWDIVGQVKVLLFKGMYLQIPELCEKGLEIASMIEDFDGSVQLLRFYKVAANYALTGSKRNDLLKDLDARENDVRNKLLNYQAWEDLDQHRLRAKGLNENEKKKIILSIRNNELLRNDGNCMSVKASILRLRLLEGLIGLENLFAEDRIPFLIEIMNLIRTNNSLLENVLIVETFLYASYNGGLLGVGFDDKNTLQAAFSSLDFLLQNSKSTETLVFERKAKLMLVAAINSEEWSNSRDIIAKTNSGLKKFGNRISPNFRSELFLDMSLCFFHLKEWRKILQILNKLINEPPIVLKASAISMQWILFIVAHLELKNFDTAKTYASYAIKYLRTNDLETEFSIKILKSLQRIGARKDANTRRKEYLFFQSKILPEIESEENLYFNTRLPFAIWLEGQINSHND